MASVAGVHLLPATGEFVYDPIPYLAAQSVGGQLQAFSGVNTFNAPGGSVTDYTTALNQLQAAHPECGTVSLVCAWFTNSTNAATCQVFPSTIYPLGAFEKWSGSTYVSDNWQVSSLTQASAGLIPIPALPGGASVYGGTPSDPSIVRCIRDLKSRGFRVIFYPFLLSTSAGYPWRGRIGYAPDASAGATTAVNAFLGSAARSQFTPDPVNLTVAYSGAPTDYTYRRMILHYAWLCAVAGGVSEFLIGSEMRGLETIRGPGWTKAGATDAGGNAIWDYPFVSGLVALAADVRAIFDGQGLTRNTSTLQNLVSYAADWSDWMGYQHPGANGQWPHLDQLWASANIDVVGIDNYMPLSDWTTGSGGIDAANWVTPAPLGPWPPSPAAMSGLGMSGPPTLNSKAYLKANIEGGEKFNWYYNDSSNLGRGLDPNGSDLAISLPEGDRLAQTRSPYSANQQILANKQFRWWWSNPHYAVYDAGDGLGWIPRGPRTQWVASAKPLAFNEYGFPAADKGTNQPNVFFDPKSTESFTPFWSIWDPAPGGAYLPRRDDTLALLALQSVYEYWTTDGRNTTVAGVPLIQFALSCVWNWDARPFPAFPAQNWTWGDAGNWAVGQWLGGRGPASPPAAPSSDPAPGSFPTFPSLPTLGWSTQISPRFDTDVADHVSGRSTRRPRRRYALYDLLLSYDVLRSDSHQELQAIAGFFAQMQGVQLPFWFAPPGLASVSGQSLGMGDGATVSFLLVRAIAGALEPVQGTSGVTAVYLNGVAQSSGWSVSGSYAPTVTFATAPAAGAAISADFGVLFLCRFAEDVADLEEMLSLLWSFRAVKLKTIRP